jgi:tRNA pseudouridine13 synthase
MTDAGSPLPSRRLLDTPPLPGVIKERPEDFLVDEIPLIEPGGSGEHVHMGIQKSGMAHDDMVDLLARHCGVPVVAIGHAGMKDRIAVTRQTVSVHLPGLPDPPVLQHPQVQMLWARRHESKLRPGQLVGNRFSIRIRRTDPLAAPRVAQALRALAARGAPNGFGPQRFGHRGNGHRLGLLLAREDWDGMLAELLGAKGSAFPERQREARERFDAGDLQGSLQAWDRGDHAERTALRTLAQGRSPRRAVMSIRESTRRFWVNAAQSAAFNAVLSRRLEIGLFDRFLAGDLANLHPGRSLFRVSAAALADSAEARVLQERIARFDCSPTGPMPGSDCMAAEDDCSALEREALAAAGMDAGILERSAFAASGERRSLRMRVGDPQVESGVDEHGAFIRVAFDLPRGGYATGVLAEILGGFPQAAEEA